MKRVNHNHRVVAFPLPSLPLLLRLTLLHPLHLYLYLYLYLNFILILILIIIIILPIPLLICHTERVVEEVVSRRLPLLPVLLPSYLLELLPVLRRQHTLHHLPHRHTLFLNFVHLVSFPSHSLLL
jgi:hypothetical protein